MLVVLGLDVGLAVDHANRTRQCLIPLPLSATEPSDELNRFIFLQFMFQLQQSAAASVNHEE